MAYERRLTWVELHSFTATYDLFHKSVAMESPLKFMVLSNVFHATGNAVYNIFLPLPYSHLKISFCFIGIHFIGQVFLGTAFILYPKRYSVYPRVSDRPMDSFDSSVRKPPLKEGYEGFMDHSDFMVVALQLDDMYRESILGFTNKKAL